MTKILKNFRLTPDLAALLEERAVERTQTDIVETALRAYLVPTDDAESKSELSPAPAPQAPGYTPASHSSEVARESSEPILIEGPSDPDPVVDLSTPQKMDLEERIRVLSLTLSRSTAERVAKLELAR